RVELVGFDLVVAVADGREGGLPVLADRGPAWVVWTTDPDHVRSVGELLDGLLDGCLGLRCGESLLGVEDDVRRVERFLRESVLDGVGRALRLGAGQVEAFVRLTADRGVEQENRGG